MNVLHVCASPKPIAESASKQLAASFFARLAEKNPDANVTNVDLYNNPPPYLANDAYRCFWQPVYQPGYEPTEEEKKAGAYARAQCEMLRESDVLVMTMPMWNGSMPAIMKAWLDQVLAPNEIFKIEGTEIIPTHLVRKVILLVSSGAALKEGDPDDALTPQVNAAMGFIGVNDIAIAWADGQDPIMNPDWEDRKKTALEAAQELAEEVAAMT